MNVTFETAVLAPGGAQGASNVRLNGRQIVDDGQFFRAAMLTYFPRGNVDVSFSFTTHWIFASLALAETFVMTHVTYLPMTNQDNGVLQVVCGAETLSPVTIYSPSAVLESAEITDYIGLSVDVRYTLRCQPFASTVPPNVPAYPSGNQLSYVLQRGLASIGAGATQLAISFSTPFASPPIVTAVMAQQAGSAAIFCRVLQNTVTVNGFTVEFSGALPDGSSDVSWIAMQ
jgi:hypothetical protein